MRQDLYNSPEKRTLRTRLWLPRVQQAVDRVRTRYPWRGTRYLTFPGPDCHDLKLFIDRLRIINLENVTAFESGLDAAGSILAKYPTLSLRRSRFEEILRSPRFNGDFPFDVINLDYSNNCFDNPYGGVPDKLRSIERVFELQAQNYTSFDLFAAFESSYQPSRPAGDRDVAKVLYDHATRLGFNAGYFRLASTGIRKGYGRTMLEVIPTIVVRMGCEQGFDTRLCDRAFYTPSGRRSKTIIVSFVFECTWNYVPLSMPRWEWAADLTKTIAARQREALERPLMRFMGRRVKVLRPP